MLQYSLTPHSISGWLHVAPTVGRKLFLLPRNLTQFPPFLGSKLAQDLGCRPTRHLKRYGHHFHPESASGTRSQRIPKTGASHQKFGIMVNHRAKGVMTSSSGAASTAVCVEGTTDLTGEFIWEN